MGPSNRLGDLPMMGEFSSVVMTLLVTQQYHFLCTPISDVSEGNSGDALVFGQNFMVYEVFI